MRKIVLPLFVLGLVAVTTPSLLRASKTHLPPLSPVLSALLVLVIVTASFLGQLSPTTSLITMPSVQATSSIPQEELKYWLTLYEKQPTHRDVLINLARLYEADNQPDKAAFYWQQAQALDPNDPLFAGSASVTTRLE